MVLVSGRLWLIMASASATTRLAKGSVRRFKGAIPSDSKESGVVEMRRVHLPRQRRQRWACLGVLELCLLVVAACDNGCGTGIDVELRDSGVAGTDARANDAALPDVTVADSARSDTAGTDRNATDAVATDAVATDTVATDTVATDAAEDRTVTLAWDSPTTNADATCLTDLAGYRLSYGTVSGDYGQTLALTLTGLSCIDTGAPDPSAPSCGNIQECTYTTPELVAGEWFFVVDAYDLDGNHSTYTNEVSRVIP